MRQSRKRGQFVILAAATMAIILLLLSVQVYNAANINQEVKFKSYKEIVETINSDYQKAFTFVLRNATRGRAQISNNTELFTRFHEMSIDEQRAESTYGDQNAIGNSTIEFLDSWAKVSKAALAGFGVSIDINTPSIQLQYFWNEESGSSSALADVAFNITRIGFTGFRAGHSVLLEALIDSDDLDEQWAGNSNVTNVKLRVTGVDGLPVNDLGVSNFAVYNLNATSPGYWIASPLSDVEYEGLGNYQLNLAQHAVDPDDTRFFLIIISDSREVIVLISYHP